MGERRSYPPSGPAWTAAGLLAAHAAVVAYHRSCDDSHDYDTVNAMWRDWWADAQTVWTVLEVIDVLGRRRQEATP